MKNSKVRLAALLAAFLVPFIAAAGGSAEILSLPDHLTQIEKEAFCNDTSLVEVVIPDSVRSVGERAFFGCANLQKVTVPSGVGSVGDDAFGDCAEDMLILTEPDSAAYAYAQAHSMDYQAGTVYRALLIGQTYSQDARLKLDGPANDVAAMQACLEAFQATPYQVCLKMDLTAKAMLESIDEVFSQATPCDVSLFYYSGHGVASPDDAQSRGALLGIDGVESVSAAQLRNALDRVPGRKIVVIDACYSGSFLALDAAKRNGGLRQSAKQDPARDFAESFIQAFSERKRGGLATDGYYVMTAASADEESYEACVGEQVMGLFTFCLLKGCGFEGNFAGNSFLPSDINGNRVITFQEAFQYAATSLNIQRQHAQAYPSACAWFGILRR